MLYYKVRSRAWPWAFYFKSLLKIPVGQCFKITFTNRADFNYKGEYKVLDVSETPPEVDHELTEICGVDFEGVLPF
jgi:hypothetical protein